LPKACTVILWQVEGVGVDRKTAGRKGGWETGCAGRRYRLFQNKQYTELHKAQLKLLIWTKEGAVGT
jgi:hypothetical protein